MSVYNEMKIFSDIKISSKLIADVVIYRIKKREMANLFASISLMLLSSFPISEMAIRVFYGLCLNALVYFVNDYYDVEIDLQNPKRDRERVLFLSNHRFHALFSLFFLFFLLFLWALFYSKGLFIPLMGGVITCWLYSSWLKKVPIADIVSMALWGGIMSTTGIKPDSTHGWLLIAQLALFSACFESVQTIRDRLGDKSAGIKTTAVFLGITGARNLTKVLICLSSVYAILFLHRILGFFIAVPAFFLPIEQEKTEIFWNRIRVIFGLTWLAMILHFYIDKSTFGFIYATILKK
jgi:4-hydroxybenzoate polyprenyltransferase